MSYSDCFQLLKKKNIAIEQAGGRQCLKMIDIQLRRAKQYLE